MEDTTVVTEEVVETIEEEVKGEETGFDIKSVLENPEFKAMMESYGDKRVTSALAKKDIELKEKLADAEKKSKMTVEELQATRETELQERENTIAKQELQINKINLFRDKKYSLDLADFVNGNTIEEIGTNAELLQTTIKTLVEKEVVERLKGGYKPVIGAKTTSGKNPWAKETFNLTEQGKMFLENPALAQTLMNSQK